MRPHRPRWRRRLLRAGVCLLLGAVTTVGVAWGCAVWAPEPPFVYRDDWSGPTYIPWRADPPAGWPAEAQDWDVEQTRLITHRTLTAGGWWQSPSSQTMCQQELVESGWPLRAMVAVWHTEASILPSAPARRVPSSAVKRGLEVEWLTGTSNAPGPGVPRSLPLTPLLPGFLLDMLFYAVPWWALLVTPGLVKRWRRKRRGACVACGYDLRGLGDDAKCPECGT